MPFSMPCMHSAGEGHHMCIKWKAFIALLVGVNAGMDFILSLIVKTLPANSEVAVVRVLKVLYVECSLKDAADAIVCLIRLALRIALFQCILFVLLVFCAICHRA